MLKILDHKETDIGLLTLQHRHDARLGKDVYEIKLDDEFLMTSAFVDSEVALSARGLEHAKKQKSEHLDVLVGGLGLGYTACAALDDPGVASVCVVEKLAPVIEWHRESVLPMGQRLMSDGRSRIIHGDFFALTKSAEGFDDSFDGEQPGRRFDAILLDIDHSPSAVLNSSHAWFYEAEGVAHMRRHLTETGVFALWSNEPPEDAFVQTLGTAFPKAWAEPVIFWNPYQNAEFTQSIYFAQAG